VREWETQDSASPNWNVTVVDDETKCEIGYGRNEKKSKLRGYKIDFMARWG
jgi:hypothetical protein